MLSQVNSGVYQVLLILHILAVVVAFAPMVAHPLTGARLAKEDPAAGRRFHTVASVNSRTVHLPAMVVAGVLGFALVGVSDSAFKFSTGWVSAAIVVWLIIAGVVSAVIVPAERGMGAGDAGAETKLRLGGGIVSLLLVVALFLMVVKPG